MNSHQLDGEGKPAFISCEECGSSFTTRTTLKRHIQSVHKKETRYTCIFCGFATFYRNSLEIHLLAHEGAKPYKCKTCDFSSRNRSNLKQHELSHSAQRPYCCYECGLFFKTPQTLKCHQHAVHKRGRHFQCSLCSYYTFRKSSIQRHLAAHEKEKTPKQVDILNLKDCDFSCLKRHQRPLAEKEPIKCSECGSDFNTQRNLKRHQQTIHKYKKVFECSSCDFSTYDKTSLRKHSTVHKKRKLHKCNVCDHISSCPSALKRHYLVHTGKKAHVCESCKATFATVDGLVEHQLVCRPEQQGSDCQTSLSQEGKPEPVSERRVTIPHKCIDCNFYTDSVPSLQGHVLRGHSDSQKCSVCEAQFRSREGLRLHFLDHMGKLPFRCRLCGSAFKQKVLLTHHIAVNHKENH